jgi:predicted ester cyclase
MTDSTPVDLVRRLYGEVLDGGRFDLLDELVAGDFVAHGGPRGEQRGVAALAVPATAIRNAFADLHFELHDLFAGGDRVAVRWTMHGRQVAPFFGLEPPSPAPVAAAPFSRATVIFRVAGGRLVEQWTANERIQPARVAA